MMRQIYPLFLALGLSGCGGDILDTVSLSTRSAPGETLTAGPGDIVLDFQRRKSLPNAFGKADVFGRTVDAGRTVVRFIGVEDGKAKFVRQDLLIESSATTLTETPFVVPQISSSNIYGNVGGTSLYGSSSSNTFRVIPPRGSQSFPISPDPVYILTPTGESFQVEGHSITVVWVSETALSYTVN